MAPIFVFRICIFVIMFAATHVLTDGQITTGIDNTAYSSPEPAPTGMTSTEINYDVLTTVLETTTQQILSRVYSKTDELLNDTHLMTTDGTPSLASLTAVQEELTKRDERSTDLKVSQYASTTDDISLSTFQEEPISYFSPSVTSLSPEDATLQGSHVNERSTTVVFNRTIDDWIQTSESKYPTANSISPTASPVQIHSSTQTRTIHPKSIPIISTALTRTKNTDEDRTQTIATDRMESTTDFVTYGTQPSTSTAESESPYRQHTGSERYSSPPTMSSTFTTSEQSTKNTSNSYTTQMMVTGQQADSTSPTNSSTGIKIGVIAGVIAGVTVLMCVCCILKVRQLRKRRLRQKSNGRQVGINNERGQIDFGLLNDEDAGFVFCRGETVGSLHPRETGDAQVISVQRETGAAQVTDNQKHTDADLGTQGEILRTDEREDSWHPTVEYGIKISSECHPRGCGVQSNAPLAASTSLGGGPLGSRGKQMMVPMVPIVPKASLPNATRDGQTQDGGVYVTCSNARTVRVVTDDPVYENWRSKPRVYRTGTFF